MGAIAPASAKRPASTSSSLRFFLDMPASFHSTVTTQANHLSSMTDSRPWVARRRTSSLVCGAGLCCWDGLLPDRALEDARRLLQQGKAANHFPKQGKPLMWGEVPIEQLLAR